MFNNSLEIHKGSISWHQQCHKQDAHYTGYQLIIALFIFLKPKPPLHTLDSQHRKLTDTLEQNFTKEIRYQWKGREERKDPPLCLTCQPTELSIHWPSVFCLQEISEGGIWADPPLQLADEAEEVIDTLVFTLDQISKLQLGVKHNNCAHANI